MPHASYLAPHYFAPMAWEVVAVVAELLLAYAPSSDDVSCEWDDWVAVAHSRTNDVCAHVGHRVRVQHAFVVGEELTVVVVAHDSDAAAFGR